MPSKRPNPTRRPARAPRAARDPKPALRLERRALATLGLDPRNARRHPEASIEAISASLARFGQQRPIVVDQAGRIRAGEGVYLSAQRLGWTHLDVVVSDLAEDVLKAYAIADNRTSELSAWDDAQLAATLAEIVQDANVALEATGFGDEDLARLLEQMEGTPAGAPGGGGARATPGGPGATAPLPAELSDPDRDVPTEAETPARVQRGDLWRLGPHRLVCGDSTDPAAWELLLPLTMGPVALVHTDPPYGVSYQSAVHGAVANDELRDDALLALLALLSRVFAQLAPRVSEQAAWYVWHAVTCRAEFETALKMAGISVRQEIVWAKPSLTLGRADYQWQHESCLYAARAGQQPAFHGDRTKTTVWRVEATSPRGVGFTLDGGVLLLDGSGGGVLLRPTSDAPKSVRRVRVLPGHPIEICPTYEGGAVGTVWTVSCETALVHPTQKPVALVARAVENSSRPGELVVDPFGGSGSTLLAAEQLGRRAALLELEPRHCDSILARWERLTGREAAREASAAPTSSKAPRRARARK